MSRIRCAAVAFVALLLSTVPAEAQEHQSQVADPTAVIEQALEKPVTWEFVETPLEDVIKFIREDSDIQVRIDQPALDDVGLTADTPVTIHIKDLPLVSALELMLRDMDLTWTIFNDVLLITTPEIAEREAMLIKKVYPVGDLALHGLGPAVVPPSSTSCQIDGCSITPAPLQLPGSDANFGALIEMIVSTVNPTTWQNVGGPGAIQPYIVNGEEVLVVSQTYPVHRAIQRLFADFRAVKPREKPKQAAETSTKGS